MELKSMLKLGERIDIRIGRTHYRSVVQELPTRQDILALHPLDYRNLPVHLKVNQPVDAIFFNETGQFILKTQLIARMRVGNVALVRLRWLGGEPERLQQRAGYRLSVALPVQLMPVTPTDQLSAIYRTHAVDISEGGMQVAFPGKVDIGTLFNVAFELNADDSFQLRASTIRLMPPREIGGLWRLGLRFLGHTIRDKDRITRFIFKEQINRKLLGE